MVWAIGIVVVIGVKIGSIEILAMVVVVIMIDIAGGPRRRGGGSHGGRVRSTALRVFTEAFSSVHLSSQPWLSLLFTRLRKTLVPSLTLPNKTLHRRLAQERDQSTRTGLFFCRVNFLFYFLTNSSLFRNISLQPFIFHFCFTLTPLFSQTNP